MLNRVHSDLPAHVEEVMNRVIGASIEVHRHLGPGFLEAAYHRALCHELKERSIDFESGKRVTVLYKGQRLSEQVIDLLVERCVIVEIKAVTQLERQCCLATMVFL